MISTTGKDGILRLYDVRADTGIPSMVCLILARYLPLSSADLPCLAQETVAHQGLKCSRHVWLGNDQIFTTGFSKMRDREYSLFDGRNLGKAIKSQRMDTNTGVLMPVVDVERSIVYLAGRVSTLQGDNLEVESDSTRRAT